MGKMYNRIRGNLYRGTPDNFICRVCGLEFLKKFLFKRHYQEQHAS